MSAKRRRLKVAWIDPGWQPVTIGFCPSIEVFEGTLRMHGHVPDGNPSPYHDAFVYRYRHREGYQVVLVVMPVRKRSALRIVDTLVHEAVHVWQTVKKTMGEEEPSEEFEAYSLQHITRNLISAYEDLVGPIFRKK